VSDETPPGQATGGVDWAFPPIHPAPAPAPVAAPAYALLPSDPPAAPVHAEPTVDAPVGPAPSAGVLPVPRRHPAAADPVSPVRAVAGAAVAVAGVLLGIGALLWATDAPAGTPALQQSQAQSAQQAPSPSPSAEAVTTTPAPAQLPVVAPVPAPKLALTVLNNSTRTGLAARAAARYRAAGWPVKLVGSFRGRLTETTVYYDPGQQPSAAALAKAFPGITRVLPRFPGLPGSGLTVVLTRAYPA